MTIVENGVDALLRRRALAEPLACTKGRILAIHPDAIDVALPDVRRTHAFAQLLRNAGGWTVTVLDSHEQPIGSGVPLRVTRTPIA